MAQTPGNGAHLTKLSATDEGGVEAEGESEAARIERLGRQRPERLSSAWKEADFVFSIVMSQLLTEYFVSGFTVLIPTVVRKLNIPPASTTWPASAFHPSYSRSAGSLTCTAASRSTLLVAPGTARGSS